MDLVVSTVLVSWVAITDVYGYCEEAFRASV
jgi:hypothetical protein